MELTSAIHGSGNFEAILDRSELQESGNASSGPMELLVNEKLHLTKEVEHLMQQVAELTEQNSYFKAVASKSGDLAPMEERPLADEISQSLGAELIPHGEQTQKVGCIAKMCRNYHNPAEYQKFSSHKHFMIPFLQNY